MDLTIGTANVCGWRNRIHEVYAAVTEAHISILALTETRITAGDKMALTGHAIFRKDHRNNCGGVALLIHANIRSKQLTLPAEFQHLQAVATTVDSIRSS